MKQLCILLCALLGSCALSSHDHFYALDVRSSHALEARSAFVMQVNLRVSLPVMVDRSELVLGDSAGVSILEHERWAGPLSEQVTTTLGQDIEARRQNVIVASRSVSQPDGPMTSIAVDIVQLTLQSSVGAKIEVRWRVQHGNDVNQGRETFMSAAQVAGFQGLVAALDTCLEKLADRLVLQLPQ